jgi:hypothetical protein
MNYHRSDENPEFQCSVQVSNSETSGIVEYIVNVKGVAGFARFDSFYTFSNFMSAAGYEPATIEEMLNQ